MQKPVIMRGEKPLPKSVRLAMLRQDREADRQRWREARRALLSHLPSGAVWHVAIVSKGREAQAERAMHRAGFHVYCPLERVTIGTAALRRDVERPLFPQYVFFARRLDSASISGVREVSDVLGGINRQWLTAPEGLIWSLVDSERLGVFDRTDGRKAREREARRSRLSTGQAVRIVDGPLAGFPAKIKAITPKQRVICLVEMFGGQVELEAGIDKIEAAA